MRQGVLVMSFGDQVHAAAGGGGHIRHVMLGRNRHRLRALVLRRGFLPVDYAVPAQIVAPEDTTGQLWQHEVGAPMWSPLPRRYRLDDVAAALDQGTEDVDDTAGWPFSMEDFVLLSAGQPVYGPDGPVGLLRRLVVRWPGRELVALIICVGRLRRRCVRIPQAAIVGWAGDQIHIDLRQAAVQALPKYRSDDSIRSAIHHALQKDETIRRIDRGIIAVTLSDGCVTLSGHLANGRTCDLAEALARKVSGVRRVTNALVTDAQLTHDIAQALGAVDHVIRSSVRFTITHGVVVVFGDVRDACVRHAIEAAVAEAPDVRMVINELKAPDMSETAANQPLVQPRRGQSVFARNQYFGRIEHVVLDPRLRQVTAILVDSLTPIATCNWLADAPFGQRMLVLPAHAIETLSPVEVFLKIDRRTAAMAGEFRPELYVEPPAGWKPPFPYEREEVVFKAPVAQKAANPAPIANDYQSIKHSRPIPPDSDTRYDRTTPVGAVVTH